MVIWYNAYWPSWVGAGWENTWLLFMTHVPCCMRSIRHNVEPNILLSGFPTQSVSTYNYYSITYPFRIVTDKDKTEHLSSLVLQKVLIICFTTTLICKNTSISSVLNLLNPKSDQLLISPYSKTATSFKIKRMEEMITKLTSFDCLGQVLLGNNKANV